MLTETKKFYKFTKDFQESGFFETEQHKRFFKQMKADIKRGALITVSGMIGSGKTATLNKLKDGLTKEGKVFVARSLYVEKQKVLISMLIEALFRDLRGSSKNMPHGELRERALIELIKQERKPVALFVDEAHDLQMQTVREIKRLLEITNDGGRTLSVVLTGHPKLTNDLKRMSMQEIGPRAAVHSLDGAIDNRRQFIEWLLSECLADGIKYLEIIQSEAIDVLAERLVTPLQIEEYLTKTFEAGHAINEKKVTSEIVLTVLSKDINTLEAKLVRLGYDHKAVADILNIPLPMARQLMAGQLDPARAAELHQELQVVGLPV